MFIFKIKYTFQNKQKSCNKTTQKTAVKLLNELKEKEIQWTYVT